MRVLGAALVVGGLGSLGVLRAAALERRAEELTELRRALVLLRSSVAHLRLPAAAAFRAAARACSGVAGEGLQEAATLLEEGAPLSAGQAWWAAYQRRAGESFLSAADRAVLQDFCRQFGRVDTASQLGAFDAALEGLRQSLEQAAAERERFGRLFRFSGLAAGLGIVILLL